MIIKKYSVRFYYLIGILLLHINGLNALEMKLVDFVNPMIGTANSTTESALKFIKNREGNGSGGLSGNDDSGQMSAWHVFASLVFYPVSPAVPKYFISGPLFEKIIIQAPETAEGKAYIQEIKWNGKPYSKVHLNHNELLQGGLI